MAPSWKRTISAATWTWSRSSQPCWRSRSRRRDAGDRHWRIPMRPDHGHELLDDVGKAAFPGYPAIGRLTRPGRNPRRNDGRRQPASNASLSTGMRLCDRQGAQHLLGGA